MNIALILSGGTGTRLGADIPKQYIEVCGRPVISYCMEVLAAHKKIAALQIVADKMWRRFIMESMEQAAERNVQGKFKGFSEPGKNRQLSVLNGLDDIMEYADAADYVLIHDAARPLLSEQLVTGCLDTVTGHDGVLPVLPMTDTLYASTNGKYVSSLLKREEIFAGQAPEVFVLGKYYEANRRLMPEEILKINGSTEPAIMAGMDIVMISGEESNFKITTKADLERFQKMAVDSNPHYRLGMERPKGHPAMKAEGFYSNQALK